MKKTLLLVQSLLVFILILGLNFCSKKNDSDSSSYKSLLSSYVPEKVTVIRKSGITIRDKYNSKEGKVLKEVPTAIVDYSFDIVDVKPRFYKIKYVKGKTGWISAGIDRSWTKIEEGKVKILNKGGLVVSKFPNKERIGVAASGFSFEILDVWFSYYQISLPNKNKGWIYAGRINDRWVDDGKVYSEEETEDSQQNAKLEEGSEEENSNSSEENIGAEKKKLDSSDEDTDSSSDNSSENLDSEEE